MSLETSMIRTEFGISLPLSLGLGVVGQAASHGALWLGSKIYVQHKEYAEGDARKNIFRLVGAVAMVAAGALTLVSMAFIAANTSLALSLLAPVVGITASKVLGLAGATLGFIASGAVALSFSTPILEDIKSAKLG